MGIKHTRQDESEGLRRQIVSACVYGGKTQTEISEALGMSRSNFSARLRKARFSQVELQDIAEAIGCSLVPYKFKFKDGTEI